MSSRQKTKLLILFTALILSFVNSGLAAFDLTVNLITTNPGFESGSNGWYTGGGVIDTTQASEGTKSARLISDGVTGRDWRSTGYYSVAAGQEYQLSFDYKTSPGAVGCPQIRFRFFGSGGSFKNESKRTLGITNGVWQGVKITEFCPEGAIYFDVYFTVSQFSTPFTGTVWLDRTAVNPYVEETVEQIPADGSKGWSENVTLKWQPSSNAWAYLVYLGSSFNDVNSPSPSFLPGDFDFDGGVSFTDLEILAGQWLEEQPPIPGPVADTNADQDIDLADFGNMAVHYADSIPLPSSYQGPVYMPQLKVDLPVDNQDYYWRVDQVADGQVQKGQTWSFNCEDYLDYHIAAPVQIYAINGYLLSKTQQVMLQTLGGLIARTGPQLFIRNASNQLWLDDLASNYGITKTDIETIDGPEGPIAWTLDHYSNTYNSYILCDAYGDPDSLTAAVCLAAALPGSIVVDVTDRSMMTSRSVFTPTRVKARTVYDSYTHADNTIDGSGWTMKAPLESSTHRASSRTSGGGYYWVANGPADEEWIAFDLGSAVDLKTMVVWNGNISTGDDHLRGVNNYDLILADSTLDWSNIEGTLAGATIASFNGLTLAAAVGDTAITGQVVDFADTSGVRYVVMNINSNHNASPYTSLSEVRFTGGESVPMAYDARGHNEKWVWDQFSGAFTKKAIFVQRNSINDAGACLRDLPVTLNALTWWHENVSETESVFSQYRANIPCYGWDSAAAPGEDNAISYHSEHNMYTVVSDYMLNLSLFVGTASIEPEIEFTQPCSDNTYTPEDNVHYVSFCMSDMDNTNAIFSADGWAQNSARYGNSHRGQFAMGWGMPPVMMKIGPTVMKWWYDHATEKDCFVGYCSGLDYLHPSKFAELQLHMSHLDKYLQKADLSTLCILDNYHGPLTSESYRMGQLYGQLESLRGMFLGYDEGNGKIIWFNGKPLVAGRYALWANRRVGVCDTGVNLAASINALPANPYTQDGYTFVIVHAWSYGLNEVAACINNLNANVRVVTPNELIEQIYLHNLGPN